MHVHVEIHVHLKTFFLLNFRFCYCSMSSEFSSTFPFNVESLCEVFIKTARFPTVVQLGCLLCESGTVNLRRFFRDHARTPIKSKSPSGHCGWYLEQLPLRPISSASTTSRGNPSCLEVLGLRTEVSNIIKSQQPVVLQYLRKALFAYRVFIQRKGLLFCLKTRCKDFIRERDDHLLFSNS